MSEIQSTVEYRDIPGFPGHKVGDDGTIMSCWRRKGRGRARGTISVMSNMHWHIVKPTLGSKFGHLRVRLCRTSGRAVERMVHRLVLEAFVGPCPPGQMCRHFPDRDPANNRLSNLQWGTAQENQDDRKVHGTNHSVCGENHGSAKLTWDTVSAIRAEYAAGGILQKAIAEKHRVHQSLISLIVREKVWPKAK